MIKLDNVMCIVPLESWLICGSACTSQLSSWGTFSEEIIIIIIRLTLLTCGRMQDPGYFHAGQGHGRSDRGRDEHNARRSSHRSDSRDGRNGNRSRDRGGERHRDRGDFLPRPPSSSSLRSPTDAAPPRTSPAKLSGTGRAEANGRSPAGERAADKGFGSARPSSLLADAARLVKQRERERAAREAAEAEKQAAQGSPPAGGATNIVFRLMFYALFSSNNFQIHLIASCTLLRSPMSHGFSHTAGFHCHFCIAFAHFCYGFPSELLTCRLSVVQGS